MRKVCGISVSGNEMSAFKSLETEKWVLSRNGFCYWTWLGLEFVTFVKCKFEVSVWYFFVYKNSAKLEDFLPLLYTYSYIDI
jgi:hypothetical protein